MGHIVCSDLELLPERKPTSKDNLLSAINALYSRHLPIVREAEKAIAETHRDYLTLISPVSHELVRRVKNGGLILEEDFVEELHLRSGWMAEEMIRIRRAYEKQHGAAYNLANLL
jgi:hypothetical protein